MSTAATATPALIRRVLCSHQLNGAHDSRSLDELLPSLTSSNELDLELYAFIAIIVKDFIQPWYNKITPDQTFVDEVIQIIAHCTRALEQRCRLLDVDTLVLHKWPLIVSAHAQALTTARQAAGAPSTASRVSEIYHTLRPHRALSPWPDPARTYLQEDQEQNDRAYRLLLAQGVLAVLLPTEDLQSPTLFALVSEVLGDLILGSIVGGHLCNNCFLYDSIAKACSFVHLRQGMRIWAVDPSAEVAAPVSRLDRFGLLEGDLAEDGAGAVKVAGHSTTATLWAALNGLFAALGIIRAVVIAYWTAPQLPARAAAAVSSETAGSKHVETIHPETAPSAEHLSRSQPAHQTSVADPTPVLSMHVWPTLSTVVYFGYRMPWLSGILQLVAHGLLLGPLRLGGVDSRLDRLLAHYILGPLHDRALGLSLLQTLRTSVFPNNTFTPPPPAPAPADVDKSRRAACYAALNCLPEPVARAYFGVASASPRVDHPHGPIGGTAAAQEQKEGAEEESNEEEEELECMVAGVDEILALLQDPYVNRHLVYMLLEAVLVEILPELRHKNVSEILAERGVGGEAKESRSGGSS